MPTGNFFAFMIQLTQRLLEGVMMSKKGEVPSNASSPDITEYKRAEERQEEGKKGRKIVLIAIGTAALFWILEPLVHVFVFRDGNLIQLIFNPAPHEMWERLLFTCIIIVFGVYAQSIVTKRKRVKEQLRESEVRFRSVAESASDAIISIDCHGNIIYWNNAAETIFGYSADETIGKPLTLITPERFRQAHQEAVNRVVSGGKPNIIGKTVEVVGLRKDGSEFPVELSLATWETKEKTFFTGIIRDITERKRMEEALRESEERLQLMFESVTDGITVTDLNSVITEVNQKILEIHGVGSRDEVLGKSALEFIAPGNHERAMMNMRKTLEQGAVRGIEYTLIRADGSEFPSELSVSVLKDASGNPVGFIAITRDITERKLMEEELEFRRKDLEDIMQNVIDGIGVSDVQGKITQANRALAEMYGYDSPDEVIGRPFFDFVAKEDLPRIAERFQEMIVKKEKTIKNIEMIGLKKDGSKFPKMINITSSWDKDGSLIGSFVVVHDITERKRAEEELIAHHQELMEKTRELEAASQLKSEFLAGMSHELRTPLNAVIGFSELILDGVPGGEINDEQRQCLNDILSSGQHVLNLINDVLDLSKVEAGKIELKPENLNLADVIDSVAQTVRPLLDDNRHKLGVSVEEGLPPVRADKNRLRQIFLNLLSNAIKFTPAGGQLNIEVSRKGDWCQVSVIDNGIGIREEDQERIFEPFCQLDNPLTKEKSGTGLGLTLVNQIIEKHGGRIWVESEYGKGSRFTFTLPLATAD